MNSRYSVLVVVFVAVALFGIGRSRPTPPLVGTVEYANLADIEPPHSYILWPLTAPFVLGHAGEQVGYTIDGSTLTLYLSESVPRALPTGQAIVQVFRRGPNAEDNYQAVAFPGPAYFVGRAGGQLPTVYDPAAHTLTVTLP